VTGCDYLRSMRRVIVSTERGLSIWDNRAKVKTQVMLSCPINVINICGPSMTDIKALKGEGFRGGCLGN
jgi:hypothetical protein